MSSWLHQQLHLLVERRHPRGDLSSVQTLRLKMLKLIEEVVEARQCLDLPEIALRSVDSAMRYWVTHREDWLYAPHATWQSDIQIAKLKQELADVYVVLATLAVELEMLTGEEWDIQQAALDKAVRDVTRE